MLSYKTSLKFKALNHRIFYEHNENMLDISNNNNNEKPQKISKDF